MLLWKGSWSVCLLSCVWNFWFPPTMHQVSLFIFIVLLVVFIIYLATHFVQHYLYPEHKGRPGWRSAIGASHFTIPILSPFTSVVRCFNTSLWSGNFIWIGWTRIFYHWPKINHHFCYHCHRSCLHRLPLLDLSTRIIQCEFPRNIYLFVC